MRGRAFVVGVFAGAFLAGEMSNVSVMLGAAVAIIAQDLWFLYSEVFLSK